MSEDLYRSIAGRTWVPMSPDQIRLRAFRESQLGRRGYRREDVDTFLARVADESVALFRTQRRVPRA